MSSKSSKEQQVPCTRSSSTNKVSKPIAMLQRRQTHTGHNSAKGKLFCCINISLQTLVSSRFCKLRRPVSKRALSVHVLLHVHICMSHIYACTTWMHTHVHLSLHAEGRQIYCRMWT
jgi:hypothetical protein